MLCVLLAGCGAGASEAQGTPTPTPTAQELVEQVARATQNAESLSFAIEFEGAPVYADPVEKRFGLVGVEGQLQRPDAARASIRVRSAGVIATIRLVSLAGQLYATNPVTQEWQCYPPGSLFDPVVLFDAEQGIDHLISQEFEAITLVGTEEAGEGDRQQYHLSGSISGPPLNEISYGLISPGLVTADIWADVETLRVARIVLVDSETDPNSPTTWIMTTENYGGEVDIRAPVECPTEAER